MDCKSCKEGRATVSYIAHEADMSRMERTIRRLWILALVLVVLLVGTNGAWLWYESQFETVETTTVSQEVETGNGAAYVAGIGDVYNGGNPTDSYENEDQSPQG